MESGRQNNTGMYINIAHRLSEKAWAEKNYEKYYIIVQVLDYFYSIKALCSKDSIEKKELMNILYKVTHKKRSDSNEAWLNRWLFEMKLMGLMNIDYDSQGPVMISPTQLAEVHFQNQTYHQIFASLLESRRTKRLSIIAVLIAAITLLVTLMAFLVAL